MKDETEIEEYVADMGLWTLQEQLDMVKYLTKMHDEDIPMKDKAIMIAHKTETAEAPDLAMGKVIDITVDPETG